MAKTDPPAETPADPPLDLAALNQDEEMPADEAVIVADEIKAFVDRAHAFWQDSPKKWRKLKLGSERAVALVKIEARKWAQATDRAFRTSRHPDPTVLKYRVTDAKSAPPTPTETDSDG